MTIQDHSRYFLVSVGPESTSDNPDPEPFDGVEPIKVRIERTSPTRITFVDNFGVTNLCSPAHGYRASFIFMGPKGMIFHYTHPNMYGFSSMFKFIIDKGGYIDFENVSGPDSCRNIWNLAYES